MKRGMSVTAKARLRGRKKGRKLEGHYVKVGMTLKLETAERLRDVAFFTREPAASIVDRLVVKYVNAPRFKRIPRRP